MTQALTSALLHFVWQGAVVAILLWAILGLLRNRSANVRYVVSCSALALMAVLPLITMYASYQRPVPSASIETLAVATAFAGATSPSVERWLLPAWFLGVLLFSLRLLWGCRQVSVIRRRGKPADSTLLAAVTSIAARMRLDRPVRVLISTVAEGPSAIGFLRPVILLPAATVLGLTPQQLEAVLAHELAHIRRYDYLVNIIQMLVETILFYHPAVWWTSARIRHERELCCDDVAVGCCGDALCYARALATLERLRITTPRLALGSTGGSMLYRIERLVGVAKYQNSPSRWPGILAIGLGLAVFAVNTNWAQGQAQPKSIDPPGVKTDLGKSLVVERTPVEYPEAALENKVQGTVVVEATVDQTGAVSDVRAISGPQELGKAALQSVLEWHFTPESSGNKRRVSISFQTPPPGTIVFKNGAIQRFDQDVANVQPEMEREIQELKAVLDDARKNLENVPTSAAPVEYRKYVHDVEELKVKLEDAQKRLDTQDGVLQNQAAIVETDRALAELDNQLRQDQALQLNRARDVQELKARLAAAQRALELEAASPDSDRYATARATMAFLEEQIVERQQKTDQEKHSVEGRLEPLNEFGDYRLRIRGDVQTETAKQQMDAQLDALKLQIANLTAQLQALKAQREQLK